MSCHKILSCITDQMQISAWCLHLNAIISSTYISRSIEIYGMLQKFISDEHKHFILFSKRASEWGEKHKLQKAGSEKKAKRALITLRMSSNKLTLFPGITDDCSWKMFKLMWLIDDFRSHSSQLAASWLWKLCAKCCTFEIQLSAQQ